MEYITVEHLIVFFFCFVSSVKILFHYVVSCNIGPNSRTGTSDITSLQRAWETLENSGYGHNWWYQLKGWYNAIVSTCPFTCWNSRENFRSCQQRGLCFEELHHACIGWGILELVCVFMCVWLHFATQVAFANAIAWGGSTISRVTKGTGTYYWLSPLWKFGLVWAYQATYFVILFSRSSVLILNILGF